MEHFLTTNINLLIDLGLLGKAMRRKTYKTPPLPLSAFKADTAPKANNNQMQSVSNTGSRAKERTIRVTCATEKAWFGLVGIL